MKNRWFVNLALLLLVGLLAITVLYRPGVKNDNKQNPLTALDIEKITRVRIELPQQKAISIQKTDNKWFLEEPFKARANQFNVENVMRLAQAEIDPTIRFDADRPGQYGLDKPSARVWLNDNEFIFGASHPFKNLQYLLHDNRVQLIDRQHYYVISSGVERFVNTRLFHEERKLVHLKLSKQALTLHDGVWQLTPENKEIASDQVNNFINDWQYAQALNVSRYTGKPVLDRIEIHFAGETANALMEKQSLGILAYKPEFILYRKDEQLQYHFPKETGKRLLKLTSSK